VQPARPWILPTEPTRRSDLIRLGITSRMIRTGLAMGTLVRVRQGVVVGAEFWPSDPAGQHLVRAQAEVAANPGAVLSYQSAALAWGLPTPGFSPWTDLPVSVTLSPSGHSSHTVPAVHHLLGLPSGHVQRHRLGYAVTSPARTAVDLSAGLELPAALAILDGAARVICASMVPSIRRRDYSNPRLARAAVELLEEAADSTGVARLAQALGLVDPARESAPESVSAGHVFLAGLPMPTFQAEISTPLGTFFADCLWEEQRLIGECDGAMKYDDPQAYMKEKRREQILRDSDFSFVRWEATESVLRPDRMLGRIQRALGL
jgi:very-short-patch-repair endonuclease